MNRLPLKSPQQSGGGGMMNFPGKGGVNFHKKPTRVSVDLVIQIAN